MEPVAAVVRRRHQFARVRARALRTRRARLTPTPPAVQSARSVETDSESVDVGRLQKWLEGLSDDELGKYKM